MQSAIILEKCSKRQSAKGNFNQSKRLVTERVEYCACLVSKKRIPRVQNHFLPAIKNIMTMPHRCAIYYHSFTMKRKLLKIVSRAFPCVLLALVLLTPGLCRADWQLVWSDEFNQPDGSSPDPANWTYDIGNGSGGWGNNQLEYDTARTNNARIVGGQLVIEADQENYGGKNYTSARMLTAGKWSWAYGRMEARIKIPRGQGIWPAFWMLGTNINAGVSWPTCGEIDIMENIGKTTDQGTEHGTLHGPQGGGDYNGGAGVGRTYTLPGGAALADDFHVYAVEWTTNQIKFFLDTNLFFTATPSSLPGGSTWVFTQPQFIILNVAVGGNWPGNPDGTTVFPQQMLVDYVRVYNYVTAPPSPVTAVIQQGGLVSWPTTAGMTWTLQSSADGNNWSNLLGPTVGNGATNTYLDPLWPAQNSQYQVLAVSNGVGNIVANPGFETGSGSAVSGWTVTGTQPPLRVSTDANSGSYCMQLLVTNTAATANSSEIDENVNKAGGIPVIGGQTYTFSFWAKQISSGVSYVQNYGINWLNSSGVTVGSVGLTGFSAGNGVWAQFTVTNLLAPATAVNAYLKIYGATGGVSHGYGGVLIDDVALSFGTGSQTTNVVAAVVQPGIQLSWPSTSGSLYDLQWTGNLLGSSWSNLVSSVTGNGGTNIVTDTFGSDQSRYYRVVQH
jgi:beta-glucanase (GH16 family)